MLKFNSYKEEISILMSVSIFSDVPAIGHDGANEMRADSCIQKEVPDLSYVKPKSKTALDGATFASHINDSEFDSGKLDISYALDGQVIIIDNFLTSQECCALRGEIDVNPALSFWSDEDPDRARKFRDADTIECNNQTIASMLFSRIKSYFLGKDHHRNVDADDERDLVGEWVPCNLNHDILFVKYKSGGAFSPHTDGRAIHDFNLRSFQSVIVYLNTVESGGGTKFYTLDALNHLQLMHDNYNGDDGNDGYSRWTAPASFVTFEVAPIEGRILIFDQSLVHEGVPPSAPHNKYIIRSDILYSRMNPLLVSEDDQMAYTLFRQAEVMAEEGAVEESIRVFKRAFKMSPALKELMGM